MPLTYLIENNKYSLDYQDLKEKYNYYSNLGNYDFLVNAPDILHLSMIIAYLKDLPASSTLCDECVLHELVHLVTNTDTVKPVSEIKELFKTLMELK